jgi:hypothetical protein
MKLSIKIKIVGVFLTIGMIITGYFYFKYYFSEEQKNITKRKIENLQGLNLTVTIFGMNGKILATYKKVKKITSAIDGRDYTYFRTNDDRYVQIPNSVFYIAEDQK